MGTTVAMGWQDFPGASGSIAELQKGPICVVADHLAKHVDIDLNICQPWTSVFWALMLSKWPADMKPETEQLGLGNKDLLKTSKKWW